MVKRILHWVHLWFGLISGIIVFIISITGCIYVFQNEIKDTIEPWRFVEEQDAIYAPPSQLLDTAQIYIPAHQPTGLTYNGKSEAAAVGFWINDHNQQEYKVVYLNPYTAEFIKIHDPAKGSFDFFDFILHGHRALWLPYNIGRPIVGVSVIIFVLLLITGVILWWPKKWNRKSLKARFSIKLSANLKRINLDLHNALGIYVLLFALIIAFTGLRWSFKWFDHSVNYVLSAGKEKSEYNFPHSDTTNIAIAAKEDIPAIDRALLMALKKQPNPDKIYMNPVLNNIDAAIAIMFFKGKEKYYNRNTYYFDRYTLKPLRANGDRFNETSFANKVELMNYDIHTGAILGFWGKIIAFWVSLICASLPVTGVIIWLNKR